MDVFEISQLMQKRTQLLHVVMTEGGRRLDIHFEFHCSGFLGKNLSPQKYCISEVLSNCKDKSFYFWSLCEKDSSFGNLGERKWSEITPGKWESLKALSPTTRAALHCAVSGCSLRCWGGQTPPELENTRPSSRAGSNQENYIKKKKNNNSPNSNKNQSENPIPLSTSS